MRTGKGLSTARESPRQFGGATTQARYAIVELARLRPHEQTRPPLLESLVAQIRADGCLRKPILVEEEHLVILDGHHRAAALRVLGCTRIPVYLLDYDDPAIGLTTWPEAVVATVTKEEVVARGIKGDLFPSKTTRHKIALEVDEVRVRLEDLR